MHTYTFGGKNGRKHVLKESNNRIIVRTRNARSLEQGISSVESKEVLKNFNVELQFPDADVTILKTAGTVKNDLEIRDQARQLLKREPELRFAGRVLVDQDDKTVVIYTENIIIKFFDHIRPHICESILSTFNLTIKQKADYAVNMYFVSAPENTGLQIFDMAETLLKKDEVEFCHPELIRKRSMKKIHQDQWHLKTTVIHGSEINAHVNAGPAHAVTTGEGIKIALIDDGFDIDHPEFRDAGKVIHARDITSSSNDPRPRYSDNNHGTACAGVALASGKNASGVAPAAILIPIRLYAELGSYYESVAFKWAADHGADIISCSWGPADGYWEDPTDPAHTNYVDLPDSTRLAMEYAFTKGRNGAGCIITFAAGNGREDVKYDGYASYHKVIAVSACNDTNRRSVYSDYGDAVWCCFPSNDLGSSLYNQSEPLTNGIYTTDRLNEKGYNKNGDYTDTFGGTSSACPGVAGTIALLLSVNPYLQLEDVKEILKDTCDKIDAENGGYDAKGHSKYYGYGKINAGNAVAKAMILRNNKTQNDIRIISAMVNPEGSDNQNENITLQNLSTLRTYLNGCLLEVKGKKLPLSGTLNGGEARTVNLVKTGLRLSNSGASIHLYKNSKIIHSVTYSKKQVKNGKILVFS